MAIWQDASGNFHDDDNGNALSLPNWPPSLTKYAGVWPPPQTSAQQWAAYQAQAMSALASSDTTLRRIGEGVALGTSSWTAPDVVTFMQWRRQLRAILSQAQPSTIPSALPTKPAYPAGT